MTVDEIVKLLIFSGITFAIVGIAFQLMRILGKVADTLGDFRTSVQSLGSVSKQLAEDYKLISGALQALAKSLGHINKGIIEPISKVTSVLSRFRGKSSDDENEEI